MRTAPFGWWIAKAVLSAAYWCFALYVAVGLFFGDPIVPRSASEQTANTWLPRIFAIGAVLLYAALSYAWNRALSRRHAPADPQA